MDDRTPTGGFSSAQRGALLAAAFVVVVAGLKLAAAIVVPVLVAGFVAVLLSPALHVLEKWRVPTPLAVLALVLALVAATAVVANVSGRSLGAFNDGLPAYQDDLAARMADFEVWLEERGLRADAVEAFEQLSPQAALRLTGRFVAAASALLGNTLLILLIIVFMLLEASLLPAKLAATLDEEDWRRVRAVARDVRRYMGLKTVISAATGALVASMLSLAGVDAAVLLGLIAFALNFIPNLGSTLAAVPGVLLALVQLGPSRAALVALAYLVINVGIGNLLEPRIMGVGLGLSPLVVLLSLIFWGWVLGVVGALLAIPLTMAVVIVLDRRPETRRYAQLLTNAPVGKG